MEGPVVIGGKRQTLRLVPSAGAEGMARLEIEDGVNEAHVSLEDAIGCGHVAGERLFTVYCYPQVRKRLCLSWLPGTSQSGGVGGGSSGGSQGSGDKAPPRRAQHLRVLADSAEAAAGWATTISAELDAEVARQQQQQASTGSTGSGSGRARRKLLVVVNPVSGRRKARCVFHTVVEPMLKQAGIDYHLMVTDRMLHAHDFVEKELVLADWDGIVAIGGDGILCEVINGLFKRDPEGLSALRQMPLAIIAGGTGNGLYASTLYNSAQAMCPVSATFLVIKGRPIAADLSLIETAGGQRLLSFLMMSWGLVADVDIESEAIRWAGALRQDLFGVWAILRKKRYRGRLSFLPCPDPAVSTPAASIQLQPAALPPLAGPLPPEWVTLEDDFLMILISHVSHIAEKVHISPGKALGDGTFQILVLRKPVSRAHLVGLLLSLEHGGHVQSEALEIFAATAYRLEPLTEEGIYSMDGEVPEYGTIRGAIIPQAMRLMGALT